MPNEDYKLNSGTLPIHSSEGEKFKIVWDREFREMLRANPGIIKTAIALTDRAIAEYNPTDNPIPNYYVQIKYDKEEGKWLEEIRNLVLGPDGKIQYDPVSGDTITEHADWKDLTFGRGTILVPGEPIKDEKTGLEVMVLGRSNRELQGFSYIVRFDKCDYLRMSFGDQSFFIKRSFISLNPGFAEFQNTTRAKDILKDLDFVKVVEAKLGFQDKRESWYVSKWEELESTGFGSIVHLSLDDYGRKKEGKLPDYDSPEFNKALEERRGVEKLAEVIKQKLEEANIHADLEANLFYNPKTKIFFLLDVTKAGFTEELGKPLR